MGYSVNNQIKCIIVDDENGAIEILQAYINKVTWLQLEASFSDPLEALNHLSHNAIDLVFMDINMPDLNGIQLSRMIQSETTSIIFCTAYSEHAVESYELPALDYLLKPIPFDRFLNAVNKVQRKGEPKIDNPDGANLQYLEKIFIKSGSQIHQIETGRISYIKKDGHYIIFKMGSKELLSRMTFSQLLELLPANQFIQVHRSYVVALDKIEVIQKQFIEIEGKEIPVGDAFKKDFFKRVDFIGN
jgi:two-component system, LytTR family, response regulator